MKPQALAVLIIAMLINSIAAGQSNREFTDKVANYKIVLAADWHPLSYTDSVGREKTEFVFHHRVEGLLRIAKESRAGQSLGEKVHSDLNDMKLRCACVYASQETFLGGQLSGIRVALYYIENGHKLVGTYYYLQDADSVWVLRFTAEAESTGISREISDKMARSFCSVCPFL